MEDKKKIVQDDSPDKGMEKSLYGTAFSSE